MSRRGTWPSAATRCPIGPSSRQRMPNVGRSTNSFCQQRPIMSQSLSSVPSSRGHRPPSRTYFVTSGNLTNGYLGAHGPGVRKVELESSWQSKHDDGETHGCFPPDVISHKRIPKAQTSDAAEYRCLRTHSGANHRPGSRILYVCFHQSRPSSIICATPKSATLMCEPAAQRLAAACSDSCPSKSGWKHRKKPTDSYQQTPNNCVWRDPCARVDGRIRGSEAPKTPGNRHTSARPTTLLKAADATASS